MDVFIELKWISPKPLQLIAVKNIFVTHSKKLNNVRLDINIDQDKPHSITIIPSKINIYKITSSFWPVYEINHSTKIIVYGFLHHDPIWRKAQNILSKYYLNLKQKYNFRDKIPQDIMDLCCVFYRCSLTMPLRLVSPFTLLFVTLGMQSALAVQGWELMSIRKQCEYLKSTAISTLKKRRDLANDLICNIYNFSHISQSTISRVQDQIIMVLTKYAEQKKIIYRNDFYSDYDISDHVDLTLSFMSHLVNNATYPVTRHHDAWIFLEYFRRYCKDINYTAKDLYNALHGKRKSDRKYNITQILQNIYRKYKLSSYSPSAPIIIEFIAWCESIYSRDFNGPIHPENSYIETSSEFSDDDLGPVRLSNLSHSSGRTFSLINPQLSSIDL
eukprot:478620_1